MTSKHQVAAIHRESTQTDQTGADRMKVTLTLLSVVVAVALVGAGCGALTQQVPTPRPADSPSSFLEPS